ncbi:hypothetical protein [Seonamhaeicola sp.]|uniref:hypothetical protein n=1 Tax=Seonamhaeicola sp. TaxID=1912245 RepID=UPI0026113EF5|nr:hypothetical protein [Seonamhaeicola sp.]
MDLSPKARHIYTQIHSEDTKLGDLRNIAKAIKKDHVLALELWSTAAFNTRQLVILIMDKKKYPEGVRLTTSRNLLKLKRINAINNKTNHS